MPRASKSIHVSTPPGALPEAAPLAVATQGLGMPGVPSDGTRLALLKLLKLRGELDVLTLARELDVSNVAVRQHLANLRHAGQIASRTVRRPVGRPATLYRLTEMAEAVFPQSSDRMALDLLARLEKVIGAEALEKLFQARLRDLSKQYTERLAGAKTWAEKLTLLAQIRDEEGYLCHVEPAPASAATPEGSGGALRLIEHHCPVAAIAKQHPQVCRYELELFKRVLGDPGLKRAEHILSGGHACVYESAGPKKKQDL